MTEQQRTFTPVVMPQTPTDTVGEFIEYAKSIGIGVSVKKSDNPDTFEKIFGDMKEGESE